MRISVTYFVAAIFAGLSFQLASVQAQVPQILNYQGRIAVSGVNFDGSGQFKFALVNSTGTTTFWSNDGTSTAGSQPTAAVALTVMKGLYSVLLGDTTLANMQAVPATVFSNSDVRLRVWFNDGTNGFQQLTPDQRISAVGYAIIAGSVPSGAITSSMIANGAVGSNQLASNLAFTGTTTGKFSGDGSALTGVPAGTVTGDLALPATSGASAGVITQNGSRLLHTFGTSNFFAGINAGNFTLSGTADTATGFLALQGITSGGNNTADGYKSLFSNTTGSGNTATGAGTLLTNTTGGSNTAIGVSALTANTTASNNTATGANALATNSTGSSNTANGAGALGSNTTGDSNTAIGVSALAANTQGAVNTAAGVNALSANVNGSQNTALGNAALQNNTGGGSNTAAGVGALQSNTTGTNNSAIGVAALFSNTIGVYNTANGDHALFSNVGQQGVFGGHAPFGNYNTAFGAQSLYSNIGGDENTAVGFQSLYASGGSEADVVGDDNTSIGAYALKNNLGDYNTAVGVNSLLNNGSAQYNIALGYNAGSSVNGGSNNIEIGNTGGANDFGTIRIGTAGTHTNTYIAGTIHGDGSGLTNLATVARGGYAISNSSGAVSGSSPTVVTVGGMSAPLTTTGRPVLVSLVSASTASAYVAVNGGTANYVVFTLVRDGTAVGAVTLNSIGNTLIVPPGTVSYYDFPQSPGVHTYTLQAIYAGGGTGGQWFVVNCSLLAHEL